ncbi:hypothetical protein BJ508DRAFT_333288 [Ascobolus immersus RN42]|uniref:Transmembrane protein n=1 Tax=Ascobolus immersus RN42 TaxID=1160509 RepID=A0A3N4HQV9_ASCIM|nr:hypothetical protein BJ508DRAFT_333288 [Ascobolus immersus RN42]
MPRLSSVLSLGSWWEEGDGAWGIEEGWKPLVVNGRKVWVKGADYFDKREVEKSAEILRYEYILSVCLCASIALLASSLCGMFVTEMGIDCKVKRWLHGWQLGEHGRAFRRRLSDGISFVTNLVVFLVCQVCIVLQSAIAFVKKKYASTFRRRRRTRRRMPLSYEAPAIIVHRVVDEDTEENDEDEDLFALLAPARQHAERLVQRPRTGSLFPIMVCLQKSRLIDDEELTAFASGIVTSSCLEQQVPLAKQGPLEQEENSSRFIASEEHTPVLVEETAVESINASTTRQARDTVGPVSSPEQTAALILQDLVEQGGHVGPVFEQQVPGERQGPREQEDNSSQCIAIKENSSVQVEETADESINASTTRQARDTVGPVSSSEQTAALILQDLVEQGGHGGPVNERPLATTPSETDLSPQEVDDGAVRENGEGVGASVPPLKEAVTVEPRSHVDVPCAVARTVTETVECAVSLQNDTIGNLNAHVVQGNTGFGEYGNQQSLWSNAAPTLLETRPLPVNEGSYGFAANCSRQGPLLGPGLVNLSNRLGASVPPPEAVSHATTLDSEGDAIMTGLEQPRREVTVTGAGADQPVAPCTTSPTPCQLWLADQQMRHGLASSVSSFSGPPPAPVQQEEETSMGSPALSSYPSSLAPSPQTSRPSSPRPLSFVNSHQESPTSPPASAYGGVTDPNAEDAQGTFEEYTGGMDDQDKDWDMAGAHAAELPSDDDLDSSDDEQGPDESTGIGHTSDADDDELPAIGNGRPERDEDFGATFFGITGEEWDSDSDSVPVPRQTGLRRRRL